MKPSKAPIILVECQPRVAATGATTTIRLAGGGAAAPYRYLGQDWWPGITTLPRVVSRLGFDEAGWGGGSVPDALVIEWAPTTTAKLVTAAALVWQRAVVTIRVGFDGDADGALTTMLVGQCATALVNNGRMQIQLSDNALDMTKAVLDSRFDGSGTTNGGAEVKDRYKRRLWGRVYNVECWLLNKANNIWVIGDPTKPLQAIDNVKDKGNDASSLTTVTWQGSVAATYTALAAATAPDGGAAIAPSISCLKWWHPNPSLITVDVRGELTAVAGTYYDRPGDIISRVVGARTSLAFASGTVSALNSARNIECGLLVDDPAESVAAAVERVASGLSYWWKLTDTGEIELGAWNWGSSVASVAIEDVQRVAFYPPHKTRRLGYDKNHRKHSASELAQVLVDTLDFDNVTGANKPEDNATRNVAGNLLTDTSFQTWSLPTGWSIASAPAGSGWGDPPSDPVLIVSLSATPAASEAFEGARFQATAGEILSARVIAARSSDASQTLAHYFTFYKGDGSVLSSSASATLALADYAPGGNYVASNLTVTVPAEAAFARHVVYRTSLTSGTGVWRVGFPLVLRHEPGADVTLLVTGPDVADVAYDYDGTAKAGQLARDIAFKLVSGASTDVTASATWSRTVKSGSVTSTMGASTGILNVTALGSTSEIEISAVYGGKTRTKRVKLNRNVDAAPNSNSSGGTTVSDSTLGSCNSTTHTAVSDILTVQTGASGVITLTAPLNFYRNTTSVGASDVYGKWRWRVVGGSFADVATEVISSSQATTFNEPPVVQDQGVLTVNTSKTGLSASTNYEVQFYARNNIGTVQHVFLGTVTATGS